MLSVLNANIVSLAGGVGGVLAVVLAYGGIVQVLAGMWEFWAGNTFGAVAFGSYGAFWISVFVLFKITGIELARRVGSVGEVWVVSDQAGEAFSECERSGVGAVAAHRVVLVDGASDGDESSADGVEDLGLLAVFDGGWLAARGSRLR
jgi:hypothetical protein